MNNDLEKNICFVFSPSTADTAVAEWLALKLKSEPKKEEQFQIFSAALPWFLAHIQQDASIYMFTKADLFEALETWKEAQLLSFPKQKERITETCGLILNFFQSKTVKDYKMMIKA